MFSGRFKEEFQALVVSNRCEHLQLKCILLMVEDALYLTSSPFRNAGIHWDEQNQNKLVLEVPKYFEFIKRSFGRTLCPDNIETEYQWYSLMIENTSILSIFDKGVRRLILDQPQPWFSRGAIHKLIISYDDLDWKTWMDSIELPAAPITNTAPEVVFNNDCILLESDDMETDKENYEPSTKKRRVDERQSAQKATNKILEMFKPPTTTTTTTTKTTKTPKTPKKQPHTLTNTVENVSVMLHNLVDQLKHVEDLEELISLKTKLDNIHASADEVQATFISVHKTCSAVYVNSLVKSIVDIDTDLNKNQQQLSFGNLSTYSATISNLAIRLSEQQTKLNKSDQMTRDEVRRQLNGKISAERVKDVFNEK